MPPFESGHSRHIQQQLSEGWHQLYQRTAHALTHFMTMRQSANTLTSAEQVANGSADYALLPVCIQELEQGYRITLEVAGMQAEDFDISVVDHSLLLIRGEKRVPATLQEGQFHQLECAFGHFERQVQLPGEVDENQTRAAYRQGVLQIDIARAADRAEKRRIRVELG